MTPQEEKQLLEKLKAWRTESYEATKKYRAEAKVHKRYFAGEQLPADVMAVLENREQPVEWENTYKLPCDTIGRTTISKYYKINLFAVRVKTTI